eukprot:2677437-Rhodomonas_salina.2
MDGSSIVAASTGHCIVGIREEGTVTWMLKSYSGDAGSSFFNLVAAYPASYRRLDRKVRGTLPENLPGCVQVRLVLGVSDDELRLLRVLGCPSSRHVDPLEEKEIASFRRPDPAVEVGRKVCERTCGSERAFLAGAGHERGSVEQKDESFSACWRKPCGMMSGMSTLEVAAHRQRPMADFT